MNRLFLALLVFTPLATLAAYLNAPVLFTFILSAIAIVPLAKYIGDATQELANHTNAGLGGFLNASFGNATELIIGIFALNAGLIEVVKASLVGSILGNLLLVLGTAVLSGGWKRERQKFNVTAARASSSMLLLAALALVMPALFSFTVPNASAANVLELSVLVAVLMIIAYVALLFFSLRTHRHLYEAEVLEVEPANWSVRKSVIVLALATVAVAFMSDIFVGTITPLVAHWGFTQLFIGVIVIAIIGNVAEHVSAIQAALRDRISLAIGITVGSATQIVMFVAPVLVLISLMLAHPMSLVFNLFELVALIFSIFVANAVIDDGESNWIEGVQLLVSYVIIAVAFFFHP